jgi:tRNA(Ile)-lysidine synthase
LKMGIEETARGVRYAVFEQMAKQGKYHKVALAHHADDQAETIMFRIIRGTGRSGLVGIPPKRGMIIRPLIDVTKNEILDYLRQRRLKFCTDRSNAGTEFSRNFIRLRLLPLIRERLNPGVDRALLGLADTGAEEERFLEELVDRKSPKCLSVTPGGKVLLDASEVRRFDKWLRRRLLRRCIALLGAEMVDRETIERLDQVIVSGDGGCSVPGGIQAKIAAGKMVLFRPLPSWQFEVPLKGDCLVQPAGVMLKIRSHKRPQRNKSGGGAMRRRSQKVTVDMTKVVGRLVVRNIRPGDRFQPLGLHGSKKVGDYLTDRKLPAVLRDEVPVVCDEKGIVWLAGYEIAERVKIDSTTKEVMTFEIDRYKKSADQAV